MRNLSFGDHVLIGFLVGTAGYLVGFSLGQLLLIVVLVCIAGKLWEAA